MLKKTYHFIGIGGISMSGIARLLLEQGHHVSGSDLKDSPLLNHLRKMGARIFIGHDRTNLGNAEVVVVTSAIPGDNPELQEAMIRGIPVWQRAQMIATLMENKMGIAIAGTHGKTTTTSMVSQMLEFTGLDPTVLVGGEVNDIGGNARLGDGELLLTEADESDGSFLFLKPNCAVITNIEFEHHNFYSSREVLMDYFLKFILGLPQDGKLIMCADDEGVCDLLKMANPATSPIMYGIHKGEIRAKNVELLPFATRFAVHWDDRYLGSLLMKLPGEHNVYNSLATVVLGLTLGLDFEAIKVALESYTGVHRRFEIINDTNGIFIIDDYAHHPTEIKATLKAALECKPQRIIAMFQPHRFSRTKYLFDEFIASFDLADEIIITSIYSANEKPITGFSGFDLAREIEKRKGKKVYYFEDKSEAAKYVSTIAGPGDMVLTMGAGDIYKAGTELLSLLEGANIISDTI